MPTDPVDGSGDGPAEGDAESDREHADALDADDPDDAIEPDDPADTPHTADPDGAIGPAERDALESISHGAVVSFGGITTARVANFLTNVLLTHALGVLVYGIYAFAWQLTGIVLNFAPLGSTGTVVKYVSAAEDDAERGRIAGLAYATTVAMSLLLGLGIFTLAPAINDLTLNTPLFPGLLRLFAVGVPVFALVRIHVFLFRAVEQVNAQVLADYFVRPGIRLVAVVAALGLGLAVDGIVTAIVLASGILAVVLLPVTLRLTGVRPTLRGVGGDARRFSRAVARIPIPQGEQQRASRKGRNAFV